MRRAIACMAAMLAIGATAAGRPSGPPRMPGLYDPDPNHLWNRIHRQFHVRVAADGREYGFDSLDPLLWRETRYLLEGPSHERALGLLAEFLATHGERLIADPVRRAVFQRDLWAVFDWLADDAVAGPDKRKALMPLLARVIRRVALSRDQIDRLPDVYRATAASAALADHFDPGHPERPHLPRDFFTPSGPWVTIGGIAQIAPQHAGELSRSAFLVLWNVPGGSSQTRAYLSKLWDFPQPWIPDESFTFARDGERRVKLNPALPAVPGGTQIALVRQMLAIDAGGRIVPTKITESIQLRVFGRTDTFREFRMSRAGLFAAPGSALRAVGLDDEDFLTFSSQGVDLFERPLAGGVGLAKTLSLCQNCHPSTFEPGVLSVRSAPQLVKPISSFDDRHERWARWFTQPIQAAEFKMRRYDWGVLQGIWLSNPR